MKKLVLCFLMLAFSFQVEASSGSRFKKVLIIVLENTDYADALKQPFLQKLARRGALLTQMNGVTHPSQGNYIALLGGDTMQVVNDNPVNIKGTNLVDLLEVRGYTWKGYIEDYPGNCFTGPTKGRYARKHNPFISFIDIAQNPSRCANIVDTKTFEKDAAAGALPSFALYAPNLDDDGHDTGIGFASNWLQKNFESKFSDPQFMKELLVIITFDESKTRSGNLIYTALLGDSVVPGSSTNQTLTHIDLMRMIEDEFQLGTLGRKDNAAQGPEGIWK
ncbi:alkaline phosphatase family protein [uncultured Bdellovibrio sp.]|uniref:alkaline phosphatase family protein n=1 Tax=Bdellovibrio sp. HCB-162 TaxID=3394234 RepID=UPI0025F1B9EF|nr:alkaline phosphatase family protein [uncultured Bdellovibrio sp.]